MYSEKITLKFDQLPEEDQRAFQMSGMRKEIILKDITPRDYSDQLAMAYRRIREREKKWEREKEEEKKKKQWQWEETIVFSNRGYKGYNRNNQYALSESEAAAQFDDDYAASLYDLDPPPGRY